MARSRRKTPVFAITTATSEKKDKRRWNRIFRRVSKKLVQRGLDAPVRLDEIANIWEGDKDGKRYWCNYSKADMRK